MISQSITQADGRRQASVDAARMPPARTGAPASRSSALARRVAGSWAGGFGVIPLAPCVRARRAPRQGSRRPPLMSAGAGVGIGQGTGVQLHGSHRRLPATERSSVAAPGAVAIESATEVVGRLMRRSSPKFWAHSPSAVSVMREFARASAVAPAARAITRPAIWMAVPKKAPAAAGSLSRLKRPGAMNAPTRTNSEKPIPERHRPPSGPHEDQCCEGREHYRADPDDG